MNDIFGNQLHLGDEVVFAYYRESGMLFTGRIIVITSKSIIIKNDRWSNRRIDKSMSNCYLLRIDKETRNDR